MPRSRNVADHRPAIVHHTRLHVRRHNRSGSVDRTTAALTARCSDGVAVRVDDVVVDPIDRRVTHVVVRPPAAIGDPRLIPVDQIVDDSPDGPGGQVAGGLVLRCVVEELADHPQVVGTDFIRLVGSPVPEPSWAAAIDSVLAQPHYLASFRTARDVATDLGEPPAGSMSIRRGSAVVSAAGYLVGTVDGFIRAAAGGVTHVLLAADHGFGDRDIAVPLSSVRDVSADRVAVALSRDAIGRLPDVCVHVWHRRSSDGRRL